MVFCEKIKVRWSKLIIGGYNLHNFTPHMTISIVDHEKNNNFKYRTHGRVTLQLGWALTSLCTDVVFFFYPTQTQSWGTRFSH